MKQELEEKLRAEWKVKVCLESLRVKRIANKSQRANRSGTTQGGVSLEGFESKSGPQTQDKGKQPPAASQRIDPATPLRGMPQMATEIKQQPQQQQQQQQQERSTRVPAVQQEDIGRKETPHSYSNALRRTAPAAQNTRDRQPRANGLIGKGMTAREFLPLGDDKPRRPFICGTELRENVDWGWLKEFTMTPDGRESYEWWRTPLWANYRMKSLWRELQNNPLTATDWNGRPRWWGLCPPIGSINFCPVWGCGSIHHNQPQACPIQNVNEQATPGQENRKCIGCSSLEHYWHKKGVIQCPGECDWCGCKGHTSWWCHAIPKGVMNKNPKDTRAPDGIWIPGFLVYDGEPVRGPALERLHHVPGLLSRVSLEECAREVTRRKTADAGNTVGQNNQRIPSGGVTAIGAPPTGSVRTQISSTSGQTSRGGGVAIPSGFLPGGGVPNQIHVPPRESTRGNSTRGGHNVGTGRVDSNKAEAAIQPQKGIPAKTRGKIENPAQDRINAMNEERKAKVLAEKMAEIRKKREVDKERAKGREDQKYPGWYRRDGTLHFNTGDQEWLDHQDSCFKKWSIPESRWEEMNVGSSVPGVDKDNVNVGMERAAECRGMYEKWGLGFDQWQQEMKRHTGNAIDDILAQSGMGEDWAEQIGSKEMKTKGDEKKGQKNEEEKKEKTVGKKEEEKKEEKKEEEKKEERKEEKKEGEKKEEEKEGKEKKKETKDKE